MLYQKRQKRQTRVRRKVTAKSTRQRVTVTRSNKYLFSQLIDLATGKTLVGQSSRSLQLKGDRISQAFELGKAFAQKLKAKKINQIVFDRGAYSYHGRIKAFADGMRSQGIKF